MQVLLLGWGEYFTEVVDVTLAAVDLPCFLAFNDQHGDDHPIRKKRTSPNWLEEQNLLAWADDDVIVGCFRSNPESVADCVGDSRF
jgi:hypothetical protein